MIDPILELDIAARVARLARAQSKASAGEDTQEASITPSQLDRFIQNTDIPTRSSRDSGSVNGSNSFVINFGDSNVRYNLSKADDREKYAQDLYKKYQDELKGIKEGDMGSMRKLFNKIGADIKQGLSSGEVSPTNEADDYDIDNATELLGDIADDELKDLEAQLEKSRNAANNTSLDSGAEEQALQELERQARIQKWETLKDQSLVNYLKATLAGIKSSQKLAASAQ